MSACNPDHDVLFMPLPDFQSFTSSSQILTNSTAESSSEHGFSSMVDLANEPLFRTKSHVERWLDGQFGLDVAKDGISQALGSSGMLLSNFQLNPPQAAPNSNAFSDDL